MPQKKPSNDPRQERRQRNIVVGVRFTEKEWEQVCAKREGEELSAELVRRLTLERATD